MKTVGLEDRQFFDNRSVKVKHVTENRKQKCNRGEGEKLNSVGGTNQKLRVAQQKVIYCGACEAGISLRLLRKPMQAMAHRTVWMLGQITF